ncbi:MAG: BatA domain-containing protein, partial [bacterium]|nr:BatA domain-containing protein [bacterium]
MSFLQPLILVALPLIGLPILIHLINQWRYQTKPWGAMQFLLAANRMNRGFARIRQWLILAMRTLVVAGLIFAVARPLASGLLGFAAGTVTDTTVVIMDRSPSMLQAGIGGETKLEAAHRQIGDALSKLKSNHWVAIDSASGEAASFDSLEAMMDSPAMLPSSTSSDFPVLMQSALDYLQANSSGQTEVWICSDLRAADWNAESGNWSVVRQGFQALPQTVRFHLLTYPSIAEENIGLRVSEVRRAASTESGNVENA